MRPAELPTCSHRATYRCSPSFLGLQEVHSLLWVEGLCLETCINALLHVFSSFSLNALVYSRNTCSIVWKMASGQLDVKSLLMS